MRRRATVALALLWLLGAVAPAAERDLAREVRSIAGRLREAEPESLWAAGRRLAELGEAAVPVIKSQVGRARPAARLAMAKALCSLGQPEAAVPILVELVREKKQPQLAAMAAGMLGDEPARNVPATERELLRLCEETALDRQVTLAVARALYFTATTEESLKQANTTLRRLLVSASDRRGRLRCALALAEIDDFAPPVQAILEEAAEEPTAEGRLARSLLENHKLRKLLLRPSSREGRLSDAILNEVKSYIQRFHVEEPLSDQELINAAAKGMVSILARGEHPDRFSSYFDEDEWKKFREHITGRYAGIGAVVRFMKHFDTGDEPVFTVVRPNYDGPAYKAGIRSYDRIIAVDGEPTAGKKSEEVVGKLRGQVGTPVEVTITRPGLEEPMKLKIVRAAIELPSVRYQMLPGKIGYVRLFSFSSGTARDLEKALTDLEKQGMIALVLDLRSNPGGQLGVAVEVADKFLKHNKLIVYTEGRNKQIAPRKEFRTRDPATHPDYPIAVLVNGRSASASEIVAGALQDHKRAVLIGEKTFGKGSVQRLFPLRATAGQSCLKLTVAKYYLPSGRSIHGKGVEPDIKVAFKPTVTSKDFEHLRETGALYRYSAKHFEGNADLFARLAEFDAFDASRYPGFDQWYKGLAEEIGRDRARRLLRAWIRILVADERGADFACDFEEDNQLQRAIIELAKHFPDLDPAAIPEYRFFAKKARPAKGAK